MCSVLETQSNSVITSPQVTANSSAVTVKCTDVTVGQMVTSNYSA